MTAFVDENRDSYGVETVLRRVADRPVYLLRAQAAGTRTREDAGPVSAG